MPVKMSAGYAALLVAVIGVLVSLPCNSLWARIGVALRGLLHDPRKQRLFNLTMSATLLLLSGLFYAKPHPS
ncbi:hypothetical protein [Undibacterium sp. Ren11W]|uniref:hypothetical protein n=1 Tax=Undibacterium sp. Ren11W TaxID=3413045 RepID=UPI003BF02243